MTTIGLTEYNELIKTIVNDIVVEKKKKMKTKIIYIKISSPNQNNKIIV